MVINRAPFDTKRSLSLLGGELKRNSDPDTLVRGHVAVYGSGTQTDELMEAGKACADENDVTFNSHQSMSEGDSERERSARLPPLGREGHPGLQVPVRSQQRHP